MHRTETDHISEHESDVETFPQDVHSFMAAAQTIRGKEEWAENSSRGKEAESI